MKSIAQRSFDGHSEFLAGLTVPADPQQETKSVLMEGIMALVVIVGTVCSMRISLSLLEMLTQS